MAFFVDLMRTLGMEGEIAPARFSYEIRGDYGGRFEGVTVESYGQEEVIMKSGRFKIRVKGRSLEIRKYVENEVVLKGEIRSVERL
ncbi:MAG: YabP/YqfC family sporulation protein [Clostridia bacterium]|nr:YabP/YqfC family sporulation protein [Clostridia bacterium]